LHNINDVYNTSKMVFLGVFGVPPKMAKFGLFEVLSDPKLLSLLTCISMELVTMDACEH
jgi:hypothetical protein